MTLRAQAVQPGDLFAALAGSATHGHAIPPTRSSAVPSRCSPTLPG
ncbi:UDP-N-acetylmuramoyl-L-alanyl-D-glutamate--2,6-diaminopimelate ligase domain protein [Mycobacterium ulcerans str. Harvey]|uniref:UDP-N-acetylmuramoyl-L-alanyl-D-glutamate--2, 6-diaminopimelate ligase domain protein n=1 Tax=Mycobacterium ulcerans str. Harvey TaxID=1299332 RepID=A0ABN0QT54_MYCUL|nr:UDP-N-acetylmuramoyl-L-alanyl-D-glutamate--2,6-diaminopimelate ligase domain protein [Mycobacterium ulcerans str. Harvey]